MIYWTESDAINIGEGAVNVLKVVGQGSRYDFYINDIYVNTAYNGTFPSGYVGVTQAEGVTVQYDDLTCSYEAELLPPNAVPQQGPTLDTWVDVNGLPTDHPPVMATPNDARGSSATAANPKEFAIGESGSDHPRQHSWRGHQVSELDDFIEYRIYRNGQLISSTPDTVFTDQLPNYGTYEYRVTAVYDPEGESIPSVAEVVNWQPVTYSIEGVNTVVSYSGGTISYDALLFNELNQTFPNVTYRAYVKLPDQSIFGPVFQRTFNLNPHMYVHFPNLTQYVPADAPPGDYTFFGKLFYQGQPVLEQTFEFDKMGGGE